MIRCPECNHAVREYKSGRISPRHKLGCWANNERWNNLLITAYKSEKGEQK